jgi:DNA-binding IclR family transcriptional regulator
MAGSEGSARAALLLLELGKAGSTGAALQDIAAALAQPKPTLLRGINSLIDYGFIEQVGRGRYRLGPSIFALARTESAAALDVANWQSVLDQLAATFGQTFALVRRAGYDVVVVDKRVGGAPVQALISEIGDRLPMGIGSGSLAILATLDPADQVATISANARRYNGWNIGVDEVTEIVRRATVNGHASDLGLVIPECGGIGVPIHERGRYIATMSIVLSAPLQFFSQNNVIDVADRIKQAIADHLKLRAEINRQTRQTSLVQSPPEARGGGDSDR